MLTSVFLSQLVLYHIMEAVILSSAHPDPPLNPTWSCKPHNCYQIKWKFPFFKKENYCLQCIFLDSAVCLPLSDLQQHRGTILESTYDAKKNFSSSFKQQLNMGKFSQSHLLTYPCFTLIKPEGAVVNLITCCQPWSSWLTGNYEGTQRSTSPSYDIVRTLSEVKEHKLFQIYPTVLVSKLLIGNLSNSCLP